MASPLRSVPEHRPKSPNGLPNGRLLLGTIGLTHERLNAGRKLKAKVSVPAQLLKELLTIAASTLPFDLDFYLSTYPDIKSAYEAGRIPDPRKHFVEEGYIEGRFGSPPHVDEKYYTTKYKDVRDAVDADGGVSSALEHYLKAGAFEGRCPNAESEAALNRWMTLLGR
jgi:hypothetical protein